VWVLFGVCDENKGWGAGVGGGGGGGGGGANLENEVFADIN